VSLHRVLCPEFAAEVRCSGAISTGLPQQAIRILGAPPDADYFPRLNGFDLVLPRHIVMINKDWTWGCNEIRSMLLSLLTRNIYGFPFSQRCYLSNCTKPSDESILPIQFPKHNLQFLQLLRNVLWASK